MDRLLARKQVDVGKAARLVETMEKCNAKDTELFRARKYLEFIKTIDAGNKYLYNATCSLAYNCYDIRELEIKYGGNE